MGAGYPPRPQQGVHSLREFLSLDSSEIKVVQRQNDGAELSFVYKTLGQVFG